MWKQVTKLDNQKLKITFAPGAFDDFEGTQEELDQLVAEIKQMFESGDAFEKATPIDLDDVLEELSDEDIFHLLQEPSDRKLQ